MSIKKGTTLSKKKNQRLFHNREISVVGVVWCNRCSSVYFDVVVGVIWFNMIF